VGQEIIFEYLAFLSQRVKRNRIINGPLQFTFGYFEFELGEVRAIYMRGNVSSYEVYFLIIDVQRLKVGRS
jgi:hypothetical protein